MDGRYEAFHLDKKGAFQKFILLFLLTFLGPSIFLVARVVQVVGESAALLTYFTLS
jgi:hypothetical protein